MKKRSNKKSLLGFLMVLLLIWSCDQSNDPAPDTTVPSASFTFVLTDLSVEFTNTSKDANTYAWDFGDGSTSTDASPTHVYAASGNFDVNLVATRANGNTDSKTETITVADAPKAGFTFAVTNLEVTFTNTSTDATSYAWDFGDSNTSTDAAPVHTYAESGTFTVKLTATGANAATNEVTQDVTVVGLPVAGYSFVADDLKVTFTNTSKDATSYAWDFGDGMTSTDAAPTHTYAAAGTYTVKLTATGAGGSSNVSSQSITVTALPVANFSYSGGSLTITFTNTSTDADSYLWDFGDGKSSTEESPVHVYAAAGTYTIKLIATGVGGAKSEKMVTETVN
jgi:PKD repeat protein